MEKLGKQEIIHGMVFWILEAKIYLMGNLFGSHDNPLFEVSQSAFNNFKACYGGAKWK